MKRTNKLLAAALCAGILLAQPGALTASAVPLPADWNPDLQWDISEDGTLTIRNNGTMSDIPFFPADAPWADKAESIRKIVIGEGVTNIKAGAFENCTNVTAIEIPDTVEQIGAYAFQNCTSLQKIVLPDSVKEMDSGLFSGCTSLSDVTFPAGITEIPWSMFEHCTGLTDVEIPDTVTTIRTGAFSGTGLTEVKLPPDLTAIEGCAFSGTPLTSVEIPDGVTTIGLDAFRRCEQLTEVSIPESAVNIESFAFDHTPWSNAQIKDAPVLIINHIAVNGRKASGEIILPADVKTVNQAAFATNSRCSSVTILNPDCEICDNGEETIRAFDNEVVLRGYAGSTTQAYAELYNFMFEAIPGMPGEIIKGDVNTDYRLDIVDVIQLNKSILGILQLTGEQQTAADADGSQKVDSADVLALLKAVTNS